MTATGTAATPRSDATLMAELLAVAVRDAQGHPGVLVRDINLDPEAVLEQLQTLQEEGVDLRIAYLNPAALGAAQRLGIPEDVFSVEVEAAERWRNEPDLDALIVVITESDAPKLTSLEEFALVAPPQLRSILVERAALQFAEVNDVLPRWWEIIGKDDQMSFFDLTDYYLALAPLDHQAVKTEAAKQINRLGLLPEPGFFDNPGEAQLRARLDENRALALRLANFSEEDRQKVDKALADETDDTRRATLRKHLRDLQEYRRGGELGLTAADARQLLKVRSRSRPTPSPPPSTETGDGPPPPPAPPPPRDFTELAVDGLLRPTELGDDDETDDAPLPSVLNEAVTALQSELDSIEDSVRPRAVKLPFRTSLV